MGEHSCYEGDIELMEIPPLGKTLEQWDDIFLVHFFRGEFWPLYFWPLSRSNATIIAYSCVTIMKFSLIQFNHNREVIRCVFSAQSEIKCGTISTTMRRKCISGTTAWSQQIDQTQVNSCPLSNVSIKRQAQKYFLVIPLKASQLHPYTDKMR